MPCSRCVIWENLILIIGYTWLHKHNPEVNWETGKVEMTRCPRECNVSERRQKGIKKRKRGRRGRAKYESAKTATIEEEIDADMPNVVATDHDQEK